MHDRRHQSLPSPTHRHPAERTQTGPAHAENPQNRRPATTRRYRTKNRRPPALRASPTTLRPDLPPVPDDSNSRGSPRSSTRHNTAYPPPTSALALSTTPWSTSGNPRLSLIRELASLRRASRSRSATASRPATPSALNPQTPQRNNPRPSECPPTQSNPTPTSPQQPAAPCAPGGSHEAGEPRLIGRAVYRRPNSATARNPLDEPPRTAPAPRREQ